MSYSLHEHIKIDGRKLWLYSTAARNYTVTNDLPAVDSQSKPIARQHPLRGEPVYYNPNRNSRTMSPPPEYNPLAAVQVDGYPGEIPVTDFEVAIFENRWPGLSDLPNDIADTDKAYGRCEVVVYATTDTGSLGDMPVERLELLLNALADRKIKIQFDPQINYVMPFESRGAFVGTTLPHPHGQIYAFRDVPPNITHQMDNAKNTKFFANLTTSTDPKFIVAQNDSAMVICPPFSRYPYETWLLPKTHITSPADMTDAQINDFATLWKAQIHAYDTLFDTPMPYVMWHAMAARGYEKDWPYHIQFWSLQRGNAKMKYLASVEQITGIFLSDVLPENAAKTFRALY